MQKEKSKKVSKTGTSRGSDGKQTSITSTIEKLKEYDCSSKKWKQVKDSVMYFLVKDTLPIYTVKKVFKDFKVYPYLLGWKIF